MFAVFLPGLNFRGNRSPHLFWFYRFLSAFGPELGFICGEEYFAEPALHARRGRWEVETGVASRLGYTLPDRSVLERLMRADLPVATWEAMEAAYPADPMAAFRHFCTAEDGPLRVALAEALDALVAQGGAVEAVITCINCVTLQRLCAERGLPLVHFELGPLRAPTYLPTAYVDLTGVNGGTEAALRFRNAGPLRDSIALDTAALRKLFVVADIADDRPPVRDLGIGLQIEDDSNVVCYANGFSSVSLMRHAMREVAAGHVRAPVAVRTHPGSMFRLGPLPPELVVDTAATGLDFVLDCERLWTINSSLAVEAALLGRRVFAYGDTPAAVCFRTDGGVDEKALAFFLINYLVPWTLAFSGDYLRWRLRRPDEKAIQDTHLEGYMNEKIKALEARVAELQRQVAEKDQAMARLQSSWSWRITHPLRLLSRWVQKTPAAR